MRLDEGRCDASRGSSRYSRKGLRRETRGSCHTRRYKLRISRDHTGVEIVEICSCKSFAPVDWPVVIALTHRVFSALTFFSRFRSICLPLAKRSKLSIFRDNRARIFFHIPIHTHIAVSYSGQRGKNPTKLRHIYTTYESRVFFPFFFFPSLSLFLHRAKLFNCEAHSNGRGERRPSNLREWVFLERFPRLARSLPLVALCHSFVTQKLNSHSRGTFTDANALRRVCTT